MENLKTELGTLYNELKDEHVVRLGNENRHKVTAIITGMTKVLNGLAPLKWNTLADDDLELLDHLGATVAVESNMIKVRDMMAEIRQIKSVR